MDNGFNLSFKSDQDWLQHKKHLKGVNMKLTNKVLSILVFAFFASKAHAQVATFTNVTDSALSFYSGGLSSIDPADGNNLIIGIEQNSLSNTSSFTSSGNSASFDTVAFKATAPEGYFIQSITLRQMGSGKLQGSTARGVASGESHVAINGVSKSVVRHGSANNSSFDVVHTFDISSQQLQEISVSIGTLLKSRLASTTGSISITLQSSSVRVNLAPLP